VYQDWTAYYNIKKLVQSECQKAHSEYVSKLVSHTTFIPSISGDSYPATVPVDVTVDGVESLLSNLDQSKAGGPDGIPARLLKEMAIDLAPSLTLIFQALLRRGDVPDD